VDLHAPDQIYRCPVCRLELTFDRQTQTMILAPLHDDEEETPTLNAVTPPNAVFVFFRFGFSFRDATCPQGGGRVLNNAAMMSV